MLDILQKGGPVMWVILACSVVAVATFLERLFYLHRATVPVGDLLRGLANTLGKENYDEALQECASTPGPVARVAHAMILRHGVSRSELREVAQEAGQLEIPRLELHLPILTAIAYVAPLLGLLGTLLGMLTAFQAIANQGGYATATDVANGVYEGLLTAAFSLAVSIPSYLALCLLSARINALIHDMERAGIEIITVLDEVRDRQRPSKS